MKVISIERNTYEELLTNYNSFVSQMKATAFGTITIHIPHVKRDRLLKTILGMEHVPLLAPHCSSPYSCSRRKKC